MEISHYILMIGGALCVLLFVFILFYIIITIKKAKNLITNIQDTYTQAIFMTLTPINKIKKRLREDNELEKTKESTRN